MFHVEKENKKKMMDRIGYSSADVSDAGPPQRRKKKEEKTQKTKKKKRKKKEKKVE